MVLESNRPATGMSTNGVRPWRGRRVRPPSFGWPVASRASNGATRLGVNGRGGGRRGPSRAVELRALNLQQHCAEKSVREPIGRHGRAGPGTEPVTLYPRPRGGHAGADGASAPPPAGLGCGGSSRPMRNPGHRERRSTMRREGGRAGPLGRVPRRARRPRRGAGERLEVRWPRHASGRASPGSAGRENGRPGSSPATGGPAVIKRRWRHDAVRRRRARHGPQGGGRRGRRLPATDEHVNVGPAMSI